MRRDAGQEMPAAARRQERHRLLRQLRQVVVCPGHVTEAVAAQDATHRLMIGIRVEDQVGLRRCFAVLALKGLVQEVVQNLAVEARFLLVVVAKGGERSIRAGSVSDGFCYPVAYASGSDSTVPHAQRQLAQFVLAFRQAVRLQVEEQLQAVFGLAEEAVGIVEDLRIPGRSGSRRVPGLPGRGACCAGGHRGRSPPLSSCRNWMVNSMSRMPPCPVFTSGPPAPERPALCSICRLRALISLISPMLRYLR